jgi:hypothetical protein
LAEKICLPPNADLKPPLVASAMARRPTAGITPLGSLILKLRRNPSKLRIRSNGFTRPTKNSNSGNKLVGVSLRQSFDNPSLRGDQGQAWVVEGGSQILDTQDYQKTFTSLAALLESLFERFEKWRLN